MAMQKTVNTCGVYCTYHMIGEVVSKKRYGQTSVEVLSYVDKAARDNYYGDHIGKPRWIELDSVNPNTDKNDRDWAYEQLSGVGGQFEGATKV